MPGNIAKNTDYLNVRRLVTVGHVAAQSLSRFVYYLNVDASYQRELTDGFANGNAYLHFPQSSTCTVLTIDWDIYWGRREFCKRRKRPFSSLELSGLHPCDQHSHVSS